MFKLFGKTHLFKTKNTILKASNSLLYPEINDYELKWPRKFWATRLIFWLSFSLSLFQFNNKYTLIHVPNNLRLANYLKYSKIIKYHLLNNKIYNGCFGVQSFISHDFLVHLNNMSLILMLKILKFFHILYLI